VGFIGRKEAACPEERECPREKGRDKDLTSGNLARILAIKEQRKEEENLYSILGGEWGIKEICHRPMLMVKRSDFLRRGGRKARAVKRENGGLHWTGGSWAFLHRLNVAHYKRRTRVELIWILGGGFGGKEGPRLIALRSWFQFRSESNNASLTFFEKGGKGEILGSEST